MPADPDSAPDLHRELSQYYEALGHYHLRLANYHGVKAVAPLAELELPQKPDLIKKYSQKLKTIN
jgi:hypothetical protein